MYGERKMQNQLEKQLMEAIGQFVGIRVIYPDGDRDYHDGILEEVTPDYIKLRCIVNHYINRHVAQIVELQTEPNSNTK